jgi:hypothetical protein
VLALGSPFSQGVPHNEASTENYTNQLNSIADNLFQKYTPTNITEVNEAVTQALEGVKNVTDLFYKTGNQDLIGDWKVQLGIYVLAVWNSIMDTYGFEPPETSDETAESSGEIAKTIKALAALDTASLIVRQPHGMS